MYSMHSFSCISLELCVSLAKVPLDYYTIAHPPVSWHKKKNRGKEECKKKNLIMELPVKPINWIWQSLFVHFFLIHVFPFRYVVIRIKNKNKAYGMIAKRRFNVSTHTHNARAHFHCAFCALNTNTMLTQFRRTRTFTDYLWSAKL